MQIDSVVNLLRVVVVSGAWPGCMLTWFFSHMVALVGDLAGFLVTLRPVGLFRPLPSLFFPVLVSVTPGVGSHCWVAGMASHGSATRSRGWLADF